MLPKAPFTPFWSRIRSWSLSIRFLIGRGLFILVADITNPRRIINAFQRRFSSKLANWQRRHAENG
jgi:hypothetical protein